MADNVNVPGVGQSPVATDDVGGVHYQRMKPSFGADGSATDVSEGAQLPVVPILNSNATYEITGVTTAVAPALSAITTPLSGRRKVSIQNVSDTIIYFGFSNAVTTSLYGFLLLPNMSWSEYVGSAISIFAVHGGTGSKNVSICQYI